MRRGLQNALNLLAGGGEAFGRYRKALSKLSDRLPCAMPAHTAGLWSVLGVIFFILPVTFVVLAFIRQRDDVGDRVELVVQLLIFILHISDFSFQFSLALVSCP